MFPLSLYLACPNKIFSKYIPDILCFNCSVPSSSSLKSLIVQKIFIPPLPFDDSTLLKNFVLSKLWKQEAIKIFVTVSTVR